MFSTKEAQNSYYALLKNVKKIQFTPREVDIVAAIVHGMVASKAIAKFLLIAPKSVEAHKYNINRKLRGVSNLNIREFIENSEQYENLKIHYILLCNHNAFLNKLKQLSSQIKKFLSKDIVIYSNQNKYLAEHVSKNFGSAGIKVKTTYIKPNESSLKDKNKIHLVVSKKPFNLHNKPNNVLYLLSNPESRNTKRNDVIHFGKNTDLGFLELIDALTENNINEINIVINHFKDKFNQLNTSAFKKAKKKKNWRILNYLARKISLLPTVIIFSALASLLYSVFPENKQDSLIKSDLIIPIESAFLERNNITGAMNRKFNKQTSSKSIPTVALIGAGGSGKTTIARDYGNRYKNAAVIWEFNAQSKYTLTSSMRDLAYSLANKPHLQAELGLIMKIENQQIYLKQLVQFVKTQLKQKSSWLLIYDNMVSFSEVIHFLPLLQEEWGKGRVIITTRNQHTAETSYIDSEYVVQIDTLDDDEKNILLTKIIYGKEVRSISNRIKQQIHKFLESIPPYPLDVSIAAYSIKNTHISFDQYLQNLQSFSESYDAMQAGVMHEVSHYDKTRYGIIFSTLEEMEKTNRNFSKIFFAMCILDSQNIPYELLEQNNSLGDIDDVIYHLRKNGISLRESHADFTKSQKAISIHRITQEIGSIFFRKKLKQSQIETYTQDTVHALNSFYQVAADKKDKRAIILLSPHITSLIKFVRQNKFKNSKEMLLKLYLLSGNIYYYWQVNFAKAIYVFKQVEKYVLEGIKIPHYELAKLYRSMASICAETLNYKDSISYSKNSIKLAKLSEDTDLLISRNLRILGEVYRRKGQFDLAKSYYYKALQNIPEDYPQDTSKLKAYIYSNISELYLYKHFRSKKMGAEAVRYSTQALKLINAETPYTKSEDIPDNVDCNTAWHHRKFSRILYHFSYDFENAAKWIRSASLIVQDRCPQNMHLFGRVLFSDGGLKARRGNLILAIEKLKNAVKIHNDVLGPKTTWNVRVILAESLNRIGQFDKAFEIAIFTINLENPEKNYLHDFIYLKSYYHAAYSKYRLEDYTKSYEYFVQFIRKMDKLSKLLLTEEEYENLEFQNAFTIDKYDEFNPKDSIENYMRKSLAIYSTILGKDHPYVKDYIQYNLL